VPQPVDSKTQNLDLIRELDAQERRWRGIEHALRRLIGRLCASTMGYEPQLDPQLARIAAASRNESTEVEVRALFDALTSAVLALPKVPSTPAPPPTPRATSAPATITLSAASAAAAPNAVAVSSPATQSIEAPQTAAPAPVSISAPAAAPVQMSASASQPPLVAAPRAVIAVADTALTHKLRASVAGAEPNSRWSLSCESVDRLLEQLGKVSLIGMEIGALRTKASVAIDDAALAAVLTRVADLIEGHCASFASERAEVTATLAQVTERLQDINAYLSNTSAVRVQQHTDTNSLNSEVLSQMSQLGDEVRVSNELATLKLQVASRLEAVTASVQEFRAREQRRFEDDAQQLDRMRGRISELEQKSLHLHASLDQAKRLALRDSLTNMPNRAAFDERFTDELARWQRAHSPVSILIWDIDRFKMINDACGHLGGDKVLRETARCLGSGLRKTDFIARFGGEEFVGLLIGTPLAEALLVADQLRGQVEALRFVFHGEPVPVTVSCGLTELREGDTIESVFERADAALYKAKNSGRNACVAD
jgi:diguanylate cyclase